MSLVKKIALWYIAIGVMVACFAWSIDQYRSIETIAAIPLIAAIWPLWLLMYLIFG